MSAYYNENDPKAAAWLRELIKSNLIAPGIVDERSIEDVRPSDLKGFVQCHFFAGIGVWSLSLRNAGWSDDRAVWTGSCPCQPFSAAGKRKGTADERHLWPAFAWLIEKCRPPVIFGEQVAGKAGRVWLDLVSADLEGLGYAFGAADLAAASVGAPHIRQRNYWVADSDCVAWTVSEVPRAGVSEAGGSREAFGLEHTEGNGRLERRPESGGRGTASGCSESRMGHADSQGIGRNAGTAPCAESKGEGTGSTDGHGLCHGPVAPGPVRGFWGGAEWVFCRDGKYRPFEPGSFPLAYGATHRVGKLRGYGNAIVSPLATEFIKAYREVVDET